MVKSGSPMGIISSGGAMLTEHSIDRLTRAAFERLEVTVGL
jgi:hypothetical protein